MNQRKKQIADDTVLAQSMEVQREKPSVPDARSLCANSCPNERLSEDLDAHLANGRVVVLTCCGWRRVA